MKVLLVFAHPEPRSLNGALRDVAIKALEAQGHEVRVSDLYADGWKSEIDHADFPPLAAGGSTIPSAGSTGRSMICCFRSTTAFSTTRAMTFCRRSSYTRPTVSIRLVSRLRPSVCASECGLLRSPRRFPIGVRTAVT